MSDVPLKPTPPKSDVSRPYWEAAAEGRLLIQQCGSCKVLRHYPRLICAECYSDQVLWTEASGHGKIHSWTVAHHAFHPAFKTELPYTIVTVDLAEGPRSLGRWLGGSPKIGQAVMGWFNIDAKTPELFFKSFMEKTK
jgi:uncharacterized OB-fold protein